MEPKKTIVKKVGNSSKKRKHNYESDERDDFCKQSAVWILTVEEEEEIFGERAEKKAVRGDSEQYAKLAPVVTVKEEEIFAERAEKKAFHGGSEPSENLDDVTNTAGKTMDITKLENPVISRINDQIVKQEHFDQRTNQFSTRFSPDVTNNSPFIFLVVKKDLESKSMDRVSRVENTEEVVSRSKGIKGIRIISKKSGQMARKIVRDIGKRVVNRSVKHPRSMPLREKDMLMETNKSSAGIPDVRNWPLNENIVPDRAATRTVTPNEGEIMLSEVEKEGTGNFAEWQSTNEGRTGCRVVSSGQKSNKGNGPVKIKSSGSVGKISFTNDNEDNDSTSNGWRKWKDAAYYVRKKFKVIELGIADLPEALGRIEEKTFLEPLTIKEKSIVKIVTMCKKFETVVSFPESGISLVGEDMKRLGAEQWLNDEVINAYVTLINDRNRTIFGSNRVGKNGSGSSDDIGRKNNPPKDVPRTLMLNTFFFPRVANSGYDYNGVRRWTKRTGVDVLDYDLILVPVNLGNKHWVLGAIDMNNKMFMYLDSQKKRDKNNVMSTLQRWLYDEIFDKHGDEVSIRLNVMKWNNVVNQYVVRRTGVLPREMESESEIVGRMENVPMQTDGGSCGVFMSKTADSLSLGITVYCLQSHISLIRSRMALDLIRKKLPFR